MMPMPCTEPGIVINSQAGRMKWKGYTVLHDAKRSADFVRGHKADALFISRNMPLAAFSRFLAKIAHGFAVAQFRLTSRRSYWI